MTVLPDAEPTLAPYVVSSGVPGSTALLLSAPGGVPTIHWVGRYEDAPDPGQADRLPGVRVLAGQAHRDYLAPTLRGFRLDPEPGADWSPDLRLAEVTTDADVTTLRCVDPVARLGTTTTIECLVGGGLRLRHAVTNTAPYSRYVVEGLRVRVPLPLRYDELFHYAGRELWERVPQRHPVGDGTWVRENRRGRPGHENTAVMVAGAAGFSHVRGDVLGMHLAWSGNSAYAVERDSTGPAVLGAEELLLPGEVVLGPGESYATPWVHLVAAEGVDGVSAAFHTWLRAQPGHPAVQPVTLNVWEAVYFDHDLGRLRHLADLAARVGAERYVLDDGWFRGRRDDTSGLGDWFVDADVWPDGLGPLVDYVTGLGLEFGLWFEPEMVNPDSDLFRAHPDWVLATGDRLPQLQRHQLVLDLSRPEVSDYLFDRLDAVLGRHPIGYVKWDHNRDLLDAGTGTRAGAPGVHAQTLAYYALLDRIRAAHPDVMIESCAAGGARIDLEVLSRTQRVWTSDMTDALARQHIQRAAVSIAAPEYLGAHVSSPTSHQTGRVYTLDFRAATAFFGAFGIEWDLQTAGEQDLEQLAGWVALFKQWRPLLHSGRTVRPDSDDPSVQFHAVIAQDRRTAVVSHTQLDEPTHNRGTTLRLPGLDPDTAYRLSWVGPVDRSSLALYLPGLAAGGPVGDVPLTGRQLAEVGFWWPRRLPLSSTLVGVEAVD